jgi:hypothetical protein
VQQFQVATGWRNTMRRGDWPKLRRTIAENALGLA